MAIQVNLRGRDVQSFVQEAKAKISEKVKLPSGYFVEYGGAFKNLQEARARLAVVVPMALLLIFLLMPDNVQQQHLETLSEIAEMLSSESFREELCNEPDPAIVHQKILAWQPTPLP